MPLNIEIKARLDDFFKTVSVVESMDATARETIHQEDVFFNTPTGRLKLRIFSPESGQLIYYERPDSSDPKPSQYQISNTQNPFSLRQLLDASLGTRGTVIKVRWLYLAGQTRIHLDRVEGLGDFLELEVVMDEGQTVEEGVEIAEGLMNRLGIQKTDLLQGAYMDMLEKKKLEG